MESEHRITADILVETLHAKTGVPKDRIQNVEFTVADGSNKGDGFACVMKAVEGAAMIDGKKDTFNFMAKCMPMNPFRQKLLEDGNIFIKEYWVYRNLLPAVEKVNTTGTPLSVPKCYYQSDETKVIMMENLKLQGYKLMNKQAGFKLEEAQKFLEELSRFHAVSYHFVQTYPGGFDKLKEDFKIFFHDTMISFKTPEDREGMRMAWGGMIKACAGHYRARSAEISSKIETFADRWMDAYDKAAKPEGNFLLLIHGDCWINNCMARYADGKLQDIRLLDYQCVRYARPALDITYNLHTSLAPDLRRLHQEDLLRHYHQHLAACLQALGYSDPDQLFSFQDLRQQYDDVFGYGFVVGLASAQMLQSEAITADGGTFDVDKLTSEEDIKKTMGEIGQMKVTEVEKTRIIDRIEALVQEGLRHGLI